MRGKNLADELHFVADQGNTPAVKENTNILRQEMGLEKESDVPITSLELVQISGLASNFLVQPGKHKSDLDVTMSGALAIAVYAHKILDYDYGRFVGRVPVTDDFKEFFTRFLGAKITEKSRHDSTTRTLAQAILYCGDGSSLYFRNY